MSFETIFNKIPGWCSLLKAQRLHNLVLRTNELFPNDEIISVEAGVFYGKSLIPMALAHKELGKGYAFGVDCFNNETPLEGTNSEANNKYWRELDMDSVYFGFLNTVIENKLRSYCRFVQSRTDFAARFFEKDSITLFHQDSNHNPTVIISELDLWIPKLKMNGFWVVDDVSWSEVKDGYSHLPDYGLKLIERYDNWEIWQKVS